MVVKPSTAKEIRALPDATKRDAAELIRALYESPIELADTVLEGRSNSQQVEIGGCDRGLQVNADCGRAR
jgi:hypothetical protein